MTGINRTADDTAIRTLVAARAASFRAKDADSVLAHSGPAVVVYSLAPPLKQTGEMARARENLTAWFATWSGPLGYEISDLSVTAGEEVAFCTGFLHISGTKTDGVKNDVWVRQTLGLQKIGGVWKLVHDHSSVPFYMDGSGRAAIDLKP